MASPKKNAIKKVTAKNTKRTPSREDLISVLNSELVKIEIEFTEKVLRKFDEIISDYPLTEEECVMLLRENRKALGSTPSQKFYVDVIDGVFDWAEGQYENDIDNGDEHGFYSPISVTLDRYIPAMYELD